MPVQSIVVDEALPVLVIDAEPNVAACVAALRSGVERLPAAPDRFLTC